MIKLLHLKLGTGLNSKRSRTGSQIGLYTQTYKPYLHSFQANSSLKPFLQAKNTHNEVTEQIKIPKINSAKISELAKNLSHQEQRTKSIKALLIKQ